MISQSCPMCVARSNMVVSRLITRVGKHFCHGLTFDDRSITFNTMYLVKSSRETMQTVHRHIFPPLEHDHRFLLQNWAHIYCSCLHPSLRLKVSLFSAITTLFFSRLEDILIKDSFAAGNLFDRLSPGEFKRGTKRKGLHLSINS